MVKHIRLHNRLLYAYFAIVFFGFPLLLNTAITGGFYSRTVTVAFRGVVLALSLCTMLSGTKSNQNNSGFAECKLILIFSCLYTVRIVIDGWGLDLNLSRQPEDFLISYWGICIIPAFAAAVATSPRHSANTYNLVMMFGVISIGLICISYRNYLGTGFARLSLKNGELGPIILSKYGGSLVVLGVYGMLSTKRLVAGSTYNICLAAVCVGLAAMALGSSRGPVVAVAACFCVGFYHRFRGRTQTRAIIMVLVICVAAPFAYEAIINSGSNLISRLNRMQYEFETGGVEASRLIIWDEVARGIISEPMFGKGLEPRSSTFSHNLILDSFFNTGIIGGLIFTYVYVVGFRKASDLIREDEARGWLGMLFIFYGTHCMFSDTLYYSDTMWVSLFAVLAMHELGSVSSPSECGHKLSEIRAARPLCSTS